MEIKGTFQEAGAGGRDLLQRCAVWDLARLFVVLLFASLAVSPWKMHCLCVGLAVPEENLCMFTTPFSVSFSSLGRVSGRNTLLNVCCILTHIT